MRRFIFFIIIIGGVVAAFVLYINPQWKRIQVLKGETSSYAAALENAEALKTARQELEAQYNAIPAEQLEAVKMVLPDNVDNIRLIIQLNSIALKTGMSSLRDVDYATDEVKKSPEIEKSTSGKLYGEFQIKFSTTGSYKNFLNFVSTLEQNLRLVDITRVTFDVPDEAAKGSSANAKYVVTLKTYWLKN